MHALATSIKLIAFNPLALSQSHFVILSSILFVHPVLLLPILLLHDLPVPVSDLIIPPQAHAD